MIDIQELRAAIEERVVALIHRTEARGCRVYRSTAQSINNATLTALSWDTEVHDSDTCWASGDATKLYAPLDGYYMAGGSAGFAAAQVTAAARLFLGVRANGTSYLGSNENHTISGKDATVGVCTGMFWLAAGEYVEIVVYHDIGSAKNITAATTANQHTNSGWLMRIS